MTHQTIQDTDLWEAWIEFDHISQNRFGILYIMGEILVNKNLPRPTLVKCHLPEEPETLALQIQTSSVPAPRKVAEVVYSENVEAISQYSAVKIFQGEELLLHMEEIEIMI